MLFNRFYWIKPIVMSYPCIEQSQSKDFRSGQVGSMDLCKKIVWWKDGYLWQVVDKTFQKHWTWFY